MNLDEQLYNLPLIGWIVKRLYSYFKEHTGFTDLIHVSVGLGLAFLIVGNNFLIWGIVFLTIGILGHIYAFVKGDN